MCNACGFFCCADDGFSGCGCDDCPERKCWSEEDFDDFDDDDDMEFAVVRRGVAARPARLRCMAIPAQAVRP